MDRFLILYHLFYLSNILPVIHSIPYYLIAIISFFLISHYLITSYYLIQVKKPIKIF